MSIEELVESACGHSQSYGKADQLYQRAKVYADERVCSREFAAGSYKRMHAWETACAQYIEQASVSDNVASMALDLLAADV